jgi:hypothetical protein
MVLEREVLEELVRRPQKGKEGITRKPFVLKESSCSGVRPSVALMLT